MRQVAKLAHVHLATVWRWHLHGVRGSKLPAHLIGGRRWIFAADLDAFLGRDHSSSRARGANLGQRADDAGKLLDAVGVPVPVRNGGQNGPKRVSRSRNQTMEKK